MRSAKPPPKPTPSSRPPRPDRGLTRVGAGRESIRAGAAAFPGSALRPFRTPAPRWPPGPPPAAPCCSSPPAAPRRRAPVAASPPRVSRPESTASAPARPRPPAKSAAALPASAALAFATFGCPPRPPVPRSPALGAPGGDSTPTASRPESASSAPARPRPLVRSPAALPTPGLPAVAAFGRPLPAAPRPPAPNAPDLDAPRDDSPPPAPRPEPAASAPARPRPPAMSPALPVSSSPAFAASSWPLPAAPRSSAPRAPALAAPGRRSALLARPESGVSVRGPSVVAPWLVGWSRWGAWAGSASRGGCVPRREVGAEGSAVASLGREETPPGEGSRAVRRVAARRARSRAAALRSARLGRRGVDRGAPSSGSEPERAGDESPSRGPSDEVIGATLASRARVGGAVGRGAPVKGHQGAIPAERTAVVAPGERG